MEATTPYTIEDHGIRPDRAHGYSVIVNNETVGMISHKPGSKTWVGYLRGQRCTNGKSLETVAARIAGRA